MDTDLFQILAIVLLAVLAALLFLNYLALARVRKVIEERLQGSTFAHAGVPEIAASQAVVSREEAAPEPERVTATEPIEAGVSDVGIVAEPAPDEAVATDSSGDLAASRALGEKIEADESAAEAGDDASPEAERVDEVVGTESREAEPVTTGGSISEEPEDTGETGDDLTGIEDEPQEQPFERDGRWWFRRGDELLVYDEQTGQWMPAPTRRAGGAVSSTQSLGGGGVATETRTSGQDAGGETGYGEETEASSEAQETSGGFWKCPSCGAVNGSTATSCRMCFSARPS